MTSYKTDRAGVYSPVLMLRAYRYRIYPAPDQAVKLAKTFES